MATAIISIIAAVIAATMSGIGIWQADKANKQNQQLAIENREDQQAFATQAAKQANQATEHRYWNLYSPSSTVNQLKAAGLSPGLFYGQGGSSGQNVSAAQAIAPGSAPATVNPIIPGDMFSQIFGQTDWNEVRKTDSDIEVNKTTIEKAQHEMDEIDAKIKLIEEQTKTQAVTRMGEELKNKYQELENEYAEKSMSDRLGMLTDQRNIMKATYNKTLKEIEGLDIDNKNKQELIDLTKKRMAAETAKLWAEQLNYMKDTQLKEAERQLTEMKTVLSMQEYRKGERMIKQLDQQIAEQSKRLEAMEQNGYDWVANPGIANRFSAKASEGIDGTIDAFEDMWNWFDEVGKEWQHWSSSGGGIGGW